MESIPGPTAIWILEYSVLCQDTLLPHNRPKSSLLGLPEPSCAAAVTALSCADTQSPPEHQALNSASLCCVHEQGGSLFLYFLSTPKPVPLSCYRLDSPSLGNQPWISACLAYVGAHKDVAHHDPRGGPWQWSWHTRTST